MNLSVGLLVSFRDVRVETHFTLRSTCTADCRRSCKSCQVSTSKLSISVCSQTPIPTNLCAMIIVDVDHGLPCSHSLLFSPSRISKGVVRSSARCWHVSGPDAGHHASTRRAHLTVLAFKNTTTLPREDPPREKKTRKFGPSTLGPPTLRAPRPLGPTFSGFRPLASSFFVFSFFFLVHFLLFLFLFIFSLLIF